MVSDRVLAVARGEAEADLLLAGGSVVDVFTGEVRRGDVTVADGIIASVGSGGPARLVIDVAGRTICPGLIDAHVHIESSMLAPYEFARAVVPHGTTTVVADPHEIANVCGIDGVGWMLDSSEGLPLGVMIAASSCVPASSLATSGASLTVAELERLRDRPRVVALAEVMNVPGVVRGDPALREKLEAFRGLPVDGHAPGLGGRWLDAYVAAGVGSDHECVTAAEALARLRLGMRVFLREATGARNLVDLLPVVTPDTVSRCALCTDDRHPHDLLDDGHIDHLVRVAVRHGLDAVSAIRLATIGAAEWFRLHDRGAVAPGRRADLVVTASLVDFRADLVLSGGRVVAEGAHTVGEWVRSGYGDEVVRKPVRVDARACRLSVPAGPGNVRVIGLVPDQIVTEHLVMELPVRGGEIVPDRERDVAKLAVIERHVGSGRTGLGFVRGLGLRRGALASSVAHDHHNLVVAGADDASMRTAVAAVAGSGGGLAVADGERVVATLPLPLGGLMSDRPVEEVRGGLDALVAAAGTLGCSRDPFMALSFLALEVIPSLKLTDLGLVDVERFELVPLLAT